MKSTKTATSRVGRILEIVAGVGAIALGILAWWFEAGWTAAWGGRADYTLAMALFGAGCAILINYWRAALLPFKAPRGPAPTRTRRERHRIPRSTTAPCPHCERPIDVRRPVCVYCGERTEWA